MNNFLRMNNKKFLIFITCVYLVIFFGTIIFYSGMNYQFSDFIDKNSIAIADDWTLTESDTLKTDEVNLPISLPYDQGKTYIFSKLLDDSILLDKNKLFVQSGFSHIQLYINGKNIYEFSDYDFDTYLNKSKAKIHIIDIPQNIKNGNIEIKVSMLNNSTLSYTLYPVIVGSPVSIFYNTISEEFFSIIIIFLTAIISILTFIALIIALLTKNDKIYILFFIGIFSALSSLYAFSESNLMQLLIPNLYIINTFTFMSQLLIPVPVLAIMAEYSKQKYKKHLFIVIYMLLFDFFIQTTLNLLKIRDFRSMIPITHSAIIFTIVIILITYLKSHKDKTLSERFFFISITPTIFGVIADMFIYYLKIPVSNGFFFQISILIFIIFHLWSALQSYVNYSSVSMQSQLYKEMALTDALTGLENRASFEFKIQELNSSLNLYNSIWCISIDVNNLKYVNDTFGHSYGDLLLTSFSKLLTSSFKDVGNCYRIGGDEFIVIICNLLKPEIKDLLNILYSETEKYNNKNSLYLSFAIGYDHYRVVKDSSLSDVLIRSDKLMYKNKIEVKSIRNADDF